MEKNEIARILEKIKSNPREALEYAENEIKEQSKALPDEYAENEIKQWQEAVEYIKLEMEMP